MMNIYICEDTKEQLDKMTKIVSDTVMIEDLDMTLALSASHPDQILEAIKEETSVGLYFLDVDLQADINGIELAEKIRQYDPRGFIVFVTTHSELSYLTFTYRIEALDYIIKDDFNKSKNMVRDCILKAEERYRKSEGEMVKCFHIDSNDKVIHMDYDKILFFETSPSAHKIILNGDNRIVEFYGKMKEIESQLDERFLRCHQSYIVNRDRIKEIQKKERLAIMDNGQTCDISVRGLKVFKNIIKANK